MNDIPDELLKGYLKSIYQEYDIPKEVYDFFKEYKEASDASFAAPSMDIQKYINEKRHKEYLRSLVPQQYRP